MTTDEPLVPTINVGGNFTQGNISGQNAIGNNISQILYKDCTFLYSDGSTKTGYSWMYTQGVRPFTDSNKIFGREKELESVENLFTEKSSLVITGICGTGKSTLASMYVDRINDSGKFAGIYWRKLDETTDISEIIGSFFTVIDKPVKNLERYKTVDQINLLFQELEKAPYLLVLDNFEIILNPQTNKPLESKSGFSEFIEKANDNNTQSKILFISWESLASERGLRPFPYQINGLDAYDGILLLKREGLNDSEECLNSAVEKSGGHPLALILLAQLVRDGADTLASLLKDDSLWSSDRGEVAENILNKVYNNRLSEDERKLLQYVSIFRQSVPVKAIGAIANDPKWSDSIIKKVALSLTRKSLLQKEGENYWEESLIRTYSRTKLLDGFERHKLATNYYLSLVLEKPAKKEDVQFLIEAHHHACIVKDYYFASEIIFKFGLYESLERWGNYRALIELYTKLLPKDHFHGKPLVMKEIHCHILGNIGKAYHILGSVEKSLNYFLKALEIAQEVKDTRGECIWLGNVGNAHRDLGNIRKAIQHHKDALKISERIEDKWNQAAWLEELGTDYTLIGDYERAISYYHISLPLLREIKDKQGEEACLGNIGVIYRDLGRLEEAIEFTEKSLELAKKIENKIGEAECLGNLGTIYGMQGENKKAIQYLTMALEVSQDIGDLSGEGSCLGNLGTAYACMEDWKKALYFYENALTISRNIKNRNKEFSQLFNIGNVYMSIGLINTAIEYYEKALDMSEEINDMDMIYACENMLIAARNHF